MRIVVVLDNADKYLTVWESAVDLGGDLHVVAPAAIARRLTERAGLTVHPVPDRFVRHGRETWRIIPGLRGIVERVDPDLVHLTTEPWSITTLQALATRRPVVVHGAETIFRSGTRFERAIRAALCRLVLPRLAGYVGWNRSTIRTALREGLPASTPTLVAPAETPDPTPFDSARLRRPASRTSWAWTDDDIVVGYVGRYAPEKGLRWLARSVERVTAPGVRIHCFGDGPERRFLDDAANGSNGRLHAHGRIGSDHIPDLMAALDVLVIPSVTTDGCAEQFGRVAVEAMLAGTPIVSSECGALPEVVGEAGLLVPEGHADRLAEAIDTLAGSPEERARLAAIGRDRAQRSFAPPIIAERLLAFWADILGSDTPTDASAELVSSGPADTGRSRPLVVVLMAAHDRRETTLRCLDDLKRQNHLDADVRIILVDDGSTDGTSTAVRTRHPDVLLIDGDGSLYWSGAMRVAQSAARALRPDFLLWLNDDVALDDDALSRLLATHERLVEREQLLSIVVGALTDPETGSTTYSGRVRHSRWRRAKMDIVEPGDDVRRCDTMNGNLVLVPESVFRRLDGFDGSFRHAYSDYDFGLRAIDQGCAVWLAPGTFGTCRRDRAGRVNDPDLNAIGQVRILLSPKGLRPSDWLRFCRRHTGGLWPAQFVTPYLRFAVRLARHSVFGTSVADPRRALE